MDAKEYLEKSGLSELNNDALDDIAVSRVLEKTFLEFLEAISLKSDPRWRAIGKTHIEEGGMAIRKAIAMFKENQA